MRNTLLFISGMGLLGFVFALLLFGGDLLGQAESDDLPVRDVSVSSFPVSTPAVNEIFREEIDGALGIGQTAPDFTLVDLDGEPHTLSGLRGRPVIINFWATWCGPCRVEMPELQETFERYEEDGLAILAANREEEPEVVRAYFVDELGLTFTPLLDIDAEVADAYGVFNMPTTYFINGEGVVTAVHRGPMNVETIEGYLAATLP